MATPRTISFRIDADKVEALDKLARAMERDRSYLLNKAVEGYLDEQQRFATMVQEGIDDLNTGRTLTHEEVSALAARWEQAGQ